MASAQERERLAAVLLPRTMELYPSPHANYVLAKLIEIMPPTRLGAIGEAMRGQAISVARHRFGCRILERLVEHCSETQVGFLLDEVFADLEALARHQYGNFVVQHLLEYASPARKIAAQRALLPHVLAHTTHRTASHVVQRMFDLADSSWQAAIVDTILAGRGEASLEAMAATRYGSFVIQQLVERTHPRTAAVKSRIKAAHEKLQASTFGQKNLLDFLGADFFRD